MRILFLSHYFPPEVNAPATRTFEHCREWVRAGHEVHVVTCVPSHPRGEPFAGFRRAWYVRELQQGIHVHRVWTYLAPNRGVFRRTLNYLSFVPTAVLRALRLGRFDVIVATSPQFFCSVAGAVAGALSRTPWVFELRDLWPESVAAVGAVRTRVAVKLLERLELALYRRSSLVVCLTHAFAENLTQRGIPAAKLALIPNGVLVGDFAPAEQRAARQRLGLPGEAVIASYVGTVGMAHGIDTMLDAARSLSRDAPDVRLVVVGDGAELDAVRTRAGREGLNVEFTGQVARARAIDYLAASDVSIVLLRRSPLFRMVLPSKLFEAMAAGKPVVLGVEGEAASLLQAAGAGIAVEPQNPDALASALATLARDASLRQRLGERGRAYVRSEFDRRVLAGRYLTLLERIAAART
jgi:glycosyltransferase involved in cell wall biosynthesis